MFSYVNHMNVFIITFACSNFIYVYVSTYAFCFCLWPYLCGTLYLPVKKVKVLSVSQPV